MNRWNTPKDDLLQFEFDITWDPLPNNSYELTPKLERILKRMHNLSRSKESNVIPKLKEYIKKYPQVPSLKNYLMVAYRIRNEDAKADEVIHQIVEEHPDYLFGKLSLAEIYIKEKKLALVPALLGKYLLLQELYPNRTVFHISEVRNFEYTACLYFLEKEAFEQVESRLEVMKKLEPDSPQIEHIEFQLLIKRAGAGLKKFSEHLKKTKRVEGGTYDSSIQTDKPPVFNHPEIEILYQYDMRIPQDKVAALLALPRRTLIQDLNTVLEDTIRRHEWFQKQEWNESSHDFPIHALWLLADLKATESLPQIFRLLKQGKKLLDYWFADMLTESFWNPIYHIANANLDSLSPFLQEENINTYCKSAVATVAEQVGFHQPERRQEVIQWYEKILVYLLDNKDNEALLDMTLNGFLINDLLQLRAKESLPIIEKMFQANIVDTLFSGDFKGVQEGMNQPPRLYHARELFNNIFERYDDALKNWSYYQKKTSKAPKLPQSSTVSKPLPSPAIFKKPTYKKVGRNESCPCGSGKKYKKCCLRK